MNEITENRRILGKYRYSYACPSDVGPRARFVMEYWAPKGRKGGEWRPSVYKPEDGVYKTWRKVRFGHSHKAKLAHSIATVKPCGYAKTAAEQVALYMEWAHAKGLKRIHRFKDCKHVPPKLEGIDVVSVDPADFIGPAPDDEYDCYGDWDHDDAECPVLGVAS